MSDRRRPPHRRGAPRNEKLKAPRRSGMGSSAKGVVAIFFAFVLMYMAFRARDVFTPNVDIMTVRLGNMEMQQSVPGMIIRYEEVFTADRDGRVVFAVQEFEHVRGNTAVASIRDIEAVTRSEQEMAILQQEIMGVHEMRHATQSDPYVARLNANLRNRMDRSMHHHMQTNLSEIYILLERLTQITHNRNDMIINESVNVRNEFSRQYDAISAQIEMNSNDIYATQGGIMSPLIDGFENLFTPRNMKELNREQIRMSIDLDAIVPGREVKAGDHVFKIVNNTWYIATWMPNEMTHGYSVGANRTIYIENTSTGRYEPVPMKIEHIEHRHREDFVIFRSTRNVIDFLNQRNVNIRITDNIQSGFMIPTSAIATRRFFRIPLSHIHSLGEDNFFVVHRQDHILQNIPIQIHERTDTHADILEDTLMLSPGDSLVPVDATNTFHIISDADMRIVRGVYRTTLNFADFRVINMEGELPEYGETILLDPAKNPNIRQFDSIVTDAAMVRQGQVVR
ncbi:MAG: hypothetical protein FWD19_04885 [Defluviitaleaceae bacterium]|nr:hypothetical protein [Defluviitaleaceae bacterium]